MEGYLDQFEALNSRQFQIAIKRLADNLSYGTDHSPFLGAGIEFVQSRPYQWGDPIRSIDWRVTARTGRFHVKEYEAPKRMPCYLLLDTSASMAVSSHRRSKYGLAVQLAGGIALACLERISPVGLLGVGGRDLRFEPSLSRQQILQWLHWLRRFRYDEPTTLGRRIAEFGPSQSHRALVIVLSDLHDARGLPALKQLAQRHDVAVIQLRDPAEQQLRGAGFLRAQEAESGRQFVTHGRRRHLDQPLINEQLRRAGIDHLLIQTDEPFLHRLRHFFATRSLLGRGAR
jgi:uncharacterized protein (DUF58 family)